MASPGWLEIFTAIGSIATPIMILGLSGVGWNIRTRLERKNELENKLREDRIEIYNKILEPFIILFTTEAAWKSDPTNKGKEKDRHAIQIMMSLKYRELGFKLVLMANDEVVRAYNEIWQSFFQRGDEPKPFTEVESREMINNIGRLLLAIRKSMGNEKTNMSNLEMLEWFYKDARKQNEG